MASARFWICRSYVLWIRNDGVGELADKFEEEGVSMENVIQEPLVMDVKGLQTALGIGRDTAYSLMRSKGFPSIRIGGHYVVGKDALVIWLKRNEVKTYSL